VIRQREDAGRSRAEQGDTDQEEGMSDDNLRRRNEQLQLEVRKARDTNRALHRRLQRLEGPVQKEIASLKWQLNWQRTHNQHEFDRLMMWGGCLRECYLHAAEALGLPGNPMHSIMERWPRDQAPAHIFTKNDPRRVHANCFVTGGVQSYDIAETVRLLAERIKTQTATSDPEHRREN
jgi:hypothetical protein